MAEGTFGEWGTVTFQIPDFLEDVRDAVNDFAELLITFLEIANTALEFVKAFIKAFLDPLVALIQAILKEILAIIRDLKQIGIYITGDWALLGWPPEDLRGGFSAYERRMIARLTDRTDPTRPNVSSATRVIGFFAYLSVDPTEYEELVKFIINIIRMFGLSFFPDTSRLPIPTIREINYGNDALGVGTSFNFSALGDALSSFEGTPPPKAQVVWTTTTPSEKHPFNPFPQLGPSGYLVTVSTYEQGIPLKFSRPKSNTEKKPADGDPDKQAQPREYGTLFGKDTQPVVLHGGAEMLAFVGSGFEYNKNMKDGIPKDGTCQVFGLLDPADNDIIPLELLTKTSNFQPSALGVPGDKRGSEFYFQRTFLVPSTTALAQWFAGEYNVTFDVEDMPRDGTLTRFPDGTYKIEDGGPAGVYYVRVWSVGKEVASEGTLPQWDFKEGGAKTNAVTSGAPFIIDLKSGVDAISMSSSPRQITFPNENTDQYLHAIRTALLLVVLSRPDMPLLADVEPAKGPDTTKLYLDEVWAGQGIAKEAIGLEVVKSLVGRLVDDVASLAKPGQDPVEWCSRLHERIADFTNELYERTGPNPNLEKAVVEKTEALRTLTWSKFLGGIAASLGANINVVDFSREVFGRAKEDVLLYNALAPDSKLMTQTKYGLAPNMFSMGMGSTEADQLFYSVANFTGRSEEFVVWKGGEQPVVYEEEDASKVRALIEEAPLGLKKFYQKFVKEDGSLLVPEPYRVMFEAVKKNKRSTSSGDFTPVFYFNKPELIKFKPGDDGGDPDGFSPKGIVYFTREGVREASNGTLAAQALLTLNAASAALDRAPEDGEWIAFRLFDAFPELEEFLRSLENWVKALAAAVKSIADAILKYIEFIQAQIVELQQLIRRINAFIQQLLRFAFALPQFSGLMLFSNGTDGVMADLVAAENKPSDSPRAYGAGVGLVIPFLPSFIFDLIAVASGNDNEGEFDETTFDLGTFTTVTRPPQAIGIEDVEPAAPEEDDADVL